MKFKSILMRIATFNLIGFAVLTILISIFLINFFPEFYKEIQYDEFTRITNELKADINNQQFHSLGQVSAYFDNYQLPPNYGIEVTSEGKLLYFRGNGKQKILDLPQQKHKEDEQKRKKDLGLDEGFIETNINSTINLAAMNINIRAFTNQVSAIQAVILKFLPYLLVMSTVIALIESYILAKYFSKPIIALNNKAQAIANFDFNYPIAINQDDELGELETNLICIDHYFQDYINKIETENLNIIKRDQERKDLLSMVSHELKTPITVLSLQTEMMLNKIGKYQNRDHYLKKSLDDLATMTDLVNRILIASKIDNFDYQLKSEQVNWQELIMPLINTYTKLYPKIKVECVINEKEISTDYELMNLICKNLIENAFKYAKSKLKIQIDFEELVISNDYEHELELNEKELLNPFTQNDASRNQSGHGLGLYIVNKALNNLKCQFTIETAKQEFIWRIKLK